MGYYLSSYTVLYVTAATISAIAVLFAWQRKSAPGGAWMCATMVSTSVWAFAAAFDYSSLGLSTHVFWAKASYWGATTAPVFLLMFAFAYTGHVRWAKPRIGAVLLVAPALAIAAAYTNEMHHLVWPGFELLADKSYIITYERGPAYWAITSYGLVLGAIASALLFSLALRARTLYRTQSSAVAVAVIIPWIAQLAYSLVPRALPGFDPSITLAFTGTVLTITMLRFKLLDVIPVPRAVLVEEMAEGVLVLDHQGRVLEVNPAGARHLGIEGVVRMGDSFEKVMSNWPQAATGILGMAERDERDALVHGDGKHLGMHRLRLRSNGHDFARDLFVLRDMTAEVEAEEALQEAVRSLSVRVREVEALQAELREQAIRDPLTDLYNRRYLTETLEREVGRAAREEYMVSLIMFDIDRFKEINDAAGHAAGDLVLCTLGAEMRKGTRVGDIAFRYGGDEFGIVLPNTRIEDAVMLAERWREAWCTVMRQVGDGEVRATMSVGVAAFPVHARTPADLIAAADSGVYASKAAGRDRVSVAAAQEWATVHGCLSV